MSTATAPIRSTEPTRHAEVRNEAVERPSLYVVRGIAPARATLPLLLFVVLILVGALVSSMVLNAAMANTAFEMQQAQIRLNVLNDHIDTVRNQVEQVSTSASCASVRPRRAR